MASLRELHRSLFPSARVLGDVTFDQERGSREVSWVRVLRPTPPAFETLEPTDLAIVGAVDLAAVAPTSDALEDLSASLAAADVPAVLLVGEGGGDAPGDRSTDPVGAGAGGDRDGRLRTLGVALTQAGVTVIDLGPGEPRALERSIIGFFVNRRAELDRRAAELEAQLARYALLGRGLDVQAAAIAAFLGRAVVIEGRKGDALAVHAPADVPSAAAAVARYLGGDPARAALRVDIAAPSGQAVPGGRLVLLGDGRPTEQERIAAERVAGLLGVELARDAASRQGRTSPPEREVLPEDGPPWVVIAARQGTGETNSDPADREATRSELLLLFNQRRLMLRGTAESVELRAVAAVTPDDPEGLGIAARIAERLGRTVAVSAPFREPAGRPGAEAAARSTLEAAAALPRAPSVARATRLPAYQLLASLRSLPDGYRRAAELLAPILVGRRSSQSELLVTLREVLGAASLAEAATRLGVHRNTVAYRMDRVGQLTGWDLDDPELRLAVALAIRLVQSAQRRDEEGY